MIVVDDGYLDTTNTSIARPGDVGGRGHLTATGWDETTGFGSPLAPRFIVALSAVRGTG